MAEVKLKDSGKFTDIELWKGSRLLKSMRFTPGEWRDLCKKIKIREGDICQCGLDEPCSEGDSLCKGQKCSAGFLSCYPDDETLAEPASIKENSP